MVELVQNAGLVKKGHYLVLILQKQDLGWEDINVPILQQFLQEIMIAGIVKDERGSL